MSVRLRSSGVQLDPEQGARAAEAIQHRHEPVWVVDLCFLPVDHPHDTDSFSVCVQSKWKQLNVGAPGRHLL